MNSDDRGSYARYNSVRGLVHFAEFDKLANNYLEEVFQVFINKAEDKDDRVRARAVSGLAVLAHH